MLPSFKERFKNLPEEFLFIFKAKDVAQLQKNVPDILTADVSVLVLCCTSGIIIAKSMIAIKTLIFGVLDPIRSRNPLVAPFLGGVMVSLLFLACGNELSLGFNAFLNDDSTFSKKRQLLRLFAVILAVGSGASLALTAPAVELGMTVARLLLGKKQNTLRYVFLLSGAAAGFSANYDAPIAGIIFALEATSQCFKEQFVLKPKHLLMIAASSISATYAIRNALLPNQATMLSEFALASTKLDASLSILIFLGVTGGLVAYFFTIGGSFLVKAFGNLPFYSRPIIGGIVSMCATAVGTPVSILESFKILREIATGKLSCNLLKRFFLIKCSTTLLCCSSGMVGGIFAPLLVVGGALGGMFFFFFAVKDISCVPWTVVGCASILSAVLRCPIAVSVLMVELTRNTHLFLPILLVSGFSTVTSEILIKNTVVNKGAPSIQKGSMIQPCKAI